MTEELKPSDVLDRAADLMEERGWYRGFFISDDGAVCHLGAIYAAAGRHVHRQSTGGTWFRVIDDRVDEPRRAVYWDCMAIGEASIPAWNDIRCQSKDEAVAKLREAARMAREAGE